jgi:hypothetical protein
VTVIVVGFVFYLGFIDNQLTISTTNLPDADLSGGYERHFAVDDENILIYNGEGYEDFEVRGFQLTAFYPGYEQNKSSVDYDRVMKWLSYISDIGANTIEIPYIQPPEFYRAIYDFNLGNENPLYIIHGVPIDSNIALQYYDAYQSNLVSNLRADLMSTVEVIHGDAFLTDITRRHSGIFVYDISRYCIGYVLGENTGSEIVILTNERYNDITSFYGNFYEIENKAAFDCFVVECMDFITSYEAEEYGDLRLCSYISSPETDPVYHANETNVSKEASINLTNITLVHEETDNVFASYSVHPNTPDFMDYDYLSNPSYHDYSNRPIDDESLSSFAVYLSLLNEFYDMPLLVNDTGIPSSRGISHIDIDDGYNRGGFNEDEQGEALVSLIKDTETAGCTGVVINSFQDNWLLSSTANTEEFVDIDSSPYWQDVQSSDECFGVLEFIPTDKRGDIACIVDGSTDEWQEKEPLYSNSNISLYANADSKYLYICLPSTINLNEDMSNILIAIDNVNGIGSKTMRLDESFITTAKFPIAADFVFSFDSSGESRALVQSRSDLFRYRFGYYSNIVQNIRDIPDKDSPNFRKIYQMNRYNVMLQSTGTIDEPIYHETGLLTRGNADPDSDEFNSLTDYAMTDNCLEIRIPWLLINVTDPINKKGIYDFYGESLYSTSFFSNIGIYAQVTDKNGYTLESSETTYRIPAMKNIKFTERLKDSAAYIKYYWHIN